MNPGCSQGFRAGVDLSYVRTCQNVNSNPYKGERATTSNKHLARGWVLLLPYQEGQGLVLGHEPARKPETRGSGNYKS